MPAVDEQISATGKLVQAIGALIGLTPAVALLFDIVDVPPSLIQLIRAVSFFITVAVVVIIILLRAQIRKLSNKRAATMVLVTVLLGTASATGYWLFADSHMVTVSRGKEAERFVIPLNPSAKIRELVAPFNGQYEQALYVSRRREELRGAMEDEDTSAVLLMLFLLVSANVLLVSAVVGGAWKISGSAGRPSRRTADQPAG
jgi:hypothetical protein